MFKIANSLIFRVGRRSGDALNLYSEWAPFEPQPGTSYPDQSFSWFFSDPLGMCWDSTSIRPRPPLLK